MRNPYGYNLPTLRDQLKSEVVSLGTRTDDYTGCRLLELAWFNCQRIESYVCTAFQGKLNFIVADVVFVSQALVQPTLDRNSASTYRL